MSEPSLSRSYALAARTTRHEAGNFYVAFLTLPREQRRAVYALYAFFRELDRVADEGQASADGRRAGLEAMRRRLAAAVAGKLVASATACGRSLAEKGDAGSPLGSLTGKPSEAGLLSPEEHVCDRDLALADAVERFAIDPADLEDVVRGVEADLGPVEIVTLEDLEKYAYLVASAVGLATLAVLNGGVPPTDEMRDRAIRLGLGMQLANVVRDVGEDAAQGRIYVPRELLERHGASAESIKSRVLTPELRAALAELGERARDHLRAGRELMRYVPRHSRACLWLLSEVYERILTRIEEAHYDVFPARISLPTSEKLWLLASVRCRI
jgi:phytoene/squalene synthetase